jgi:hypothetical protein
VLQDVTWGQQVAAGGLAGDISIYLLQKQVMTQEVERSLAPSPTQP